MLLVQHAATITRNRLGLTPRDYAREHEAHDTLKAQELHQGFELRYDLVLQFSHAASGGSLRLGPPDKQLLGTAAIERALRV